MRAPSRARWAAHAGALAAVNGDFGTPRRQPTHALMVDGELWTSGAVPGSGIGWSEDGSTMFVGRARLQIRAARLTGTALFPIAPIASRSRAWAGAS